VNPEILIDPTKDVIFHVDATTASGKPIKVAVRFTAEEVIASQDTLPPELQARITKAIDDATRDS
jgi:hypothetical protein